MGLQPDSEENAVILHEFYIFMLIHTYNINIIWFLSIEHAVFCVLHLCILYLSSNKTKYFTILNKDPETRLFSW